MLKFLENPREIREAKPKILISQEIKIIFSTISVLISQISKYRPKGQPHNEQGLQKATPTNLSHEKQTCANKHTHKLPQRNNVSKHPNTHIQHRICITRTKPKTSIQFSSTRLFQGHTHFPTPSNGKSRSISRDTAPFSDWRIFLFDFAHAQSRLDNFQFWKTVNYCANLRLIGSSVVQKFQRRNAFADTKPERVGLWNVCFSSIECNYGVGSRRKPLWVFTWWMNRSWC